MAQQDQFLIQDILLVVEEQVDNVVQQELHQMVVVEQQDKLLQEEQVLRITQAEVQEPMEKLLTLDQQVHQQPQLVMVDQEL